MRRCAPPLAGIGVALIPISSPASRSRAASCVTLFNDYMPTDRGIYADLPAPPLSAGQGAHLRRLSSQLVQEAPLTTLSRQPVPIPSHFRQRDDRSCTAGIPQ